MRACPDVSRFYHTNKIFQWVQFSIFYPFIVKCIRLALEMRPYHIKNLWTIKMSCIRIGQNLLPDQPTNQSHELGGTWGLKNPNSIFKFKNKPWTSTRIILHVRSEVIVGACKGQTSPAPPDNSLPKVCMWSSDRKWRADSLSAGSKVNIKAVTRSSVTKPLVLAGVRNRR